MFPKSLSTKGLAAIVTAIGLTGIAFAAPAEPELPTLPPATPQPSAGSPPQAPPADGPNAAMEERLRKMEEANRKLLEQFEGMAKRNEELSKTVDDLSSKLNAKKTPSADGGDDAKGGDGGDAAAGDNPLGGNISPSPITGGLSPAPSRDGSAAAKDGKDKEKEKKQVKLKSFFDTDYRQRYGFVLQSENEEFELRINGLVQFDARIYQQRNQNPVISDIDMPRTRIWFSGRVTKPVEYQIAFQRNTNNFDILNAYLNLHLDDRFQIRAGRFRAPFTYEWTKLSVWEMPVPERSPFALNFGPNRQVGMMGWGNVFKDRLEYAVGVFDGPRNSYQDSNYAKDVMAFLHYRPFYRTENEYLKNFAVGGSVDTGIQNNALTPTLLRGSTNGSTNTLASGTGDTIIAAPFFGFNNNVRERGRRDLAELHASYFYKSFALYGAWDGGYDDFALTTKGAQPIHVPVSGYFIQTSYILTGETRDRITLITPKKPFDLRKGTFGLGAWEVQARYSSLTIGDEVFTSGLADRNLWSNRADFVDLGFNWYLNKYVKFQFDWQHAMFAQPVYYAPGPLLQKTSDLFWLRLQCYF